MKKRYRLIPVIAIILAFAAGILMTVLTTPVMGYIAENKSPRTEIYHDDGSITYEYKDRFYTAKKVGKLMQTVYKLNPSQENLEMVSGIYSPFTYINGTYKGNTPPADFLKSMVKYQKLVYEKGYVEGDSTYIVPSNTDIKQLVKLNDGIRYAQALYLNGQIEDSEQLVEHLINEIKENSSWSRDNSFTGYLSLRDYFYLVYSTAENVTVKKWVLDTEAEIEKQAIKSSKLSEYIERHGYLFSNPDYESYVTNNWPEAQSGKYINNVPDENQSVEVQGTWFVYENKYGENEIINGTNIKNQEDFYRNLGYEGLDEIQDDRLYIVNIVPTPGQIGKIKLLSDCEVHPYFSSGFDGTCQVVDKKIYAVKNRDEIVVFNEKGEITMSLYKSDGEIKALLVDNNFMWFLCSDKIYRLNLMTNEAEMIYEGVDFDEFLCFLRPITNHEIQWLEVFRTDKSKFECERACYYEVNEKHIITKEYIPDSQPQETLYPVWHWYAVEDPNFKEVES
ncbi:MAG: hypothetical protein J5877_06015 [Clostridia bacterium]|nr:hypothetical protein [Clostridia bacterium]